MTCSACGGSYPSKQKRRHMLNKKRTNVTKTTNVVKKTTYNDKYTKNYRKKAPLRITYKGICIKCKKKIVPETVLKLASSSLKSAGLSRQKISYLKIISKAFKDKTFEVKKIKKMNDADAIEYITKLKGLGVWSAEMFLMFNLNRSDIFPVKDIGLLRAISKNYKVSYPPSNRFLKKISKLHSGYRTVFTWYMWRSIDPTDVEY